MGNLCCTDKNNLHTRGKITKTPIKRGGKQVDVRRQTFAPNMKNFKNLKYVENINEVYNIGKKLGQGSFGSVNRAQRVGGGIDVAIKMIDKKSLDSNPMLPTLMMSELTVLKKCSHPNIMNVNEILEDSNTYYIVSELLEGGELFDRILEVQKFDE